MNDIDLLEYWRALKRRKGFVVLTTLCTVVLAVIALLVMPTVYEGNTSLLFPQQTSDTLGSQLSQLTGLSLPGLSSDFSGRDTYYSVLKSRYIAKRVCQRLNLGQYDVDYDDLQKKTVVDKQKEGGLELHVMASSSWLRGHTQGNIKQNTAQLAADIANAYIDELRLWDKDNSLALGKDKRQFMDSQVTSAKVDLTRAEDELESFQRKNPTLAPPDKISAYSDQYLDLEGKQAENEVALKEAEGQLATLRNTWNAGAPTGISPEAFADSPVIADLQGKLSDLEVRRATLLEEFTENHPDVVTVTEQIDKVKEKLKSEVDRMVSGKAASLSPSHQELLKQLVTTEVGQDGLQARRTALSGVLRKMESQAAGLPEKELTYTRLLRNVKTAEMVYTTLLGAQAKAHLDEAKNDTNFIVLDRAEPAKKPLKPRKGLTLVASFMLGFFGGIAIVLRQASTGKGGYSKSSISTSRNKTGAEV